MEITNAHNLGEIVWAYKDGKNLCEYKITEVAFDGYRSYVWKWGKLTDEIVSDAGVSYTIHSVELFPEKPNNKYRHKISRLSDCDWGVRVFKTKEEALQHKPVSSK